MEPWCKPDNTAAYKPGVGAGESPGTSPIPVGTLPGGPRRIRDHATADQKYKQPTLNEWSEVAAQLRSAASDTSRKLESHLASMDDTLKGLGPYLAQMNVLGPYLAQVNRILERLEQRLGPVGQPKPCAADRPDIQPRAVPTPVTVTEQGTILRYLVSKSETQTYRKSGAQPTSPGESRRSDEPDTPPSDVITPRGNSPEMVDWEADLNGCQVDWGGAGEADASLTRPTETKQPDAPSAPDNADRLRESGAQPTPREATPDDGGPNAQPSDAPMLQGDNTLRFDWRVDLRDNTYKYDRLLEPVGPAEQRLGRDTPFRTPATLNLQPIRLLRRWSDETLGSRGGHDKESQAPRERTPGRGQTDSPVSHRNSWNRVEVRPQCA